MGVAIAIANVDAMPSCIRVVGQESGICYRIYVGMALTM